MNIAYCIPAYKNTKILRTTIDLLSKDNDIYLHVDKKADINEFEEYRNIDRVKFLDNRIEINWGEFTQTELYILFMKKIVEKNIYDYMSVISDSDLPLKGNDDIKNFFIQNKGKEFMSVTTNINEINNAISWVKYKYIKPYFKKVKTIEDRKLMYQTKRELNESFCKLPKIYKGEGWFSITNELCKYILEYINKNQWYVDAFQHSFSSIEVFFHTIVMNSEYRYKTYKSLRYIDWSKGGASPKVLTEMDFNLIKKEENKECIFARKFDGSLDIDKYKLTFNLK